MLHEEITDLLQGHGAGTPGVDFFFAAIPDTPNDVIGVYEYGGEPPLTAKTQRLPVNELARFQVLTRSAGYATGKARAETVHRILIGFSGALLGVGYARIAALQSVPFFLDRDDKGRFRFACNYQARKEPSPLPG